MGIPLRETIPELCPLRFHLDNIMMRKMLIENLDVMMMINTRLISLKRDRIIDSIQDFYVIREGVTWQLTQ